MFPSATHGDGVRAGPDGPSAYGGPTDREGARPADAPVGPRTPGPGPLATRPAARLRTPALLAVLGVSLLWAYWPTLGRMAQTWSTDPRYSHGYLVPLF